MLNNNSRPARTERVLEANYGNMAKGGWNFNINRVILMDDIVHTIVLTMKDIATMLHNIVRILHHLEESKEEEAWDVEAMPTTTKEVAAIGCQKHQIILEMH